MLRGGGCRFASENLIVGLTRTLAVQLDRYACGTSANGRSLFFVSRTLESNGHTLSFHTRFVKNFLAVFLVVSVCL